jgi:glycosyltransferase involved in cell wall biosynthesis
MGSDITLTNMQRNHRLNYILCIPTYKRPRLLARLIDDVMKQSIKPSTIVVVDGDHKSGEVKHVLEQKANEMRCEFLYIRSNFANLSYQRYLAWFFSQTIATDILLYLDDDLHIEDTDAIKNLLIPFEWDDKNILGTTGLIIMGDHTKLSRLASLQDGYSNKPIMQRIIKKIGSSKSIKPGGLTPSGNRKLPVIENDGYGCIEWLRGGVMAYRMVAISEDSFLDDLFALDQIRCGLGEDTILSRRIGNSGKLLMVSNAKFHHPHDDHSRTYPVDAYNLGYARAYSRRFQNDHYRIYYKPQLFDRLNLIGSYIGNIAIILWQILSDYKNYRVAYLSGYIKGALLGIIRKPTTQILTPNINWRLEARKIRDDNQFIKWNAND